MTNPAWDEQRVEMEIGGKARRLENGAKVLKSLTGSMVAVVGDYNKGKTWLISKLADSEELPSGMTITTPGLSFKQTKVNQDDILFVDCQGRNSAIPMSSDSFEEACSEEQFQLDVQKALCPNVVLCVNKISREEQKTLLSISKSYESVDGAQAKRTMFVVHNLRHVSTKQELYADIERISSLFGADDIGGADDAGKNREMPVSRYPKSRFKINCMLTTIDDDGDIEIILPSEDVSPGPPESWEKHASGQVARSDGTYVWVEWDDPRCQYRTFFTLESFKEFERRRFMLGDGKNDFQFKRYGGQEGIQKHFIVRLEGEMSLNVVQKHYFLVDETNSGKNDFSRTWNDECCQQIRSALLACCIKSKTEGLGFGSFNLGIELHRALSKVAPTYFNQTSNQGKSDPTKPPSITVTAIQCDIGRKVTGRRVPEIECDNDSGNGGSAEAGAPEMRPTLTAARCKKRNTIPYKEKDKQVCRQEDDARTMWKMYLEPTAYYDYVLAPSKLTHDFRCLTLAKGCGLELKVKKKHLMSPTEETERTSIFYQCQNAEFRANQLDTAESSFHRNARPTVGELEVVLGGQKCKVLSWVMTAKTQCQRWEIDCPGMEPFAFEVGGKGSDINVRSRNGRATLSVKTARFTRRCFKNQDSWTRQETSIKNGNGALEIPLDFIPTGNKVKATRENGTLVIEAEGSLEGASSDEEGDEAE